jgi:BioD-like phosphotransacetylase family protein
MSSATSLRVFRGSRKASLLQPHGRCYKSTDPRNRPCEEEEDCTINSNNAPINERTQRQASTSPPPPPIYVAATRQHVGKTSTSLALLSGFQKRFDQVGFMKPVGQQSLQVHEDGALVDVDKDAVLVKKHFHLHHLKYKHMSPVLIPPGYTRDYLDGKIRLGHQAQLVARAYEEISATSQIVLCEGTGHCAVGSIVHASNAQVAKWMNAKMILVANGGLGNTFDELELNKALCDKEGVEICGVIINKVLPEKLEQTRHYISKALQQHWGKDMLLGCIPDRPFLGCPALSDLERLFDSSLSTGQQHRLRHYQVHDLYLVSTSLIVFLKKLKTNPSRTLYVCHASRSDILLGFLMDHSLRNGSGSEAALLVTGTDEYPLSQQVVDIINGRQNMDEAPAVLLVPQATHKVMEMIHDYTPKLNFEDASRARTAVNHYEPYIDFDLLLERTGHSKLQRHKEASTERKQIS